METNNVNYRINYKENKLVHDRDGVAHIVYRIYGKQTAFPEQEEFRGGWIEKESNLSQEGECFVHDEAVVMGDAIVKENATISDRAVVGGEAFIDRNAQVFGDAKVFGNCVVTDHSKVYGFGEVYGKAYLEGYSHVGGGRVCGTAHLNDATVDCYAYVYDDAQIMLGSHVTGSASIGHCTITDGSFIGGTAAINGKYVYISNAHIEDNAVVNTMYDFVVVNGGHIEDKNITLFHTREGEIFIAMEYWFAGEEVAYEKYVVESIDDFIKRIDTSKRCTDAERADYKAIIELAKIRFANFKKEN